MSSKADRRNHPKKKKDELLTAAPFLFPSLLGLLIFPCFRCWYPE